MPQITIDRSAIAPQRARLLGRTRFLRRTSASRIVAALCVLVGATWCSFAAAAVTPRVAVGNQHSCALTPSGRVVCWGDNTYGQIGDGAGILPPVAVQTTPAEIAAGFVSVVSGGSHSCGLQVDGTAFCWGANGFGQIGNGATSTVGISLPVRVATNMKFRSLAAGAMHTCGLATDGTAWCWGSNWYGQLGIGDPGTASASVPRPVTNYPPSALVFTSLTAGANHTCGITPTGTAQCWGDDQYGQIGVAAVSTQCKGGLACVAQSTPTAGATTFKALAGGTEATCGITTGGATVCWGQGKVIPGGGAGPTFTPIPVAGPAFTSIGVGDQFACGTVAGGGVACWGLNTVGQIGSGGPTGTFVGSPVSVSGPADYSSVSVGPDFACGVGAGSVVRCWGDSNTSQVGVTVPSVGVPTTVSGVALTSVQAGGSHVCGMDGAGITVCWGNNQFGQIGHGRAGSVPGQSVVPTPVARFGMIGAAIVGSKPPPPQSLTVDPQSGGTRVSVLRPVAETFVQVTSGAYHSCAVTQSGLAYCWGYDIAGQIADPSAAHGNCRDFNTANPGASPSPAGSCVPNPSLALNAPTPITAISAGAGHTCVLAGTAAACWGSDASGELGRTVACQSPTCAQPAGPVGFPPSVPAAAATISAEAGTTCSVDATQSVAACWGRGFSPTPTPLAGVTKPSYATSDGSHTCVMAGAQLACMGANQFGEVGDGTTHASNALHGVRLKDVVSVTLGFDFTCAIAEKRQGFCWGLNSAGQLGDGATVNSNVPMPVGKTGQLLVLDAGNQHACALNTSGAMFCWGDNTFGQIGDGASRAPGGPPVFTTSPVMVAGGVVLP